MPPSYFIDYLPTFFRVHVDNVFRVLEVTKLSLLNINEVLYELGKQVNYLFDNDVYPYCQEGKITVDSPTCDKCGFEVDKRKAVWG